MSILEVSNLSHGFGDRAIFEDVNFRLLQGEHIGFVGANGEGKSTFMSIITGTLQPDEGKVTWSKKHRVGYMDQHAALGKGKTTREALAEAFQYLFDVEAQINDAYMKMAEMDADEMTKALEEVGELQEELDNGDFYLIDAKVEETARGLGLTDLLDKDVAELSGGQRTKILLGKLLLEKPDILLLDEPTNYLDEEHIFWLKNYLKNYDNAFILISHDVPFMDEVVNVIYHVNQLQITRYSMSYHEFERVFEEKKKQLEALHDAQVAEAEKLKDFIARKKANVATSGQAKAREKKLAKMEFVETITEKPKPHFDFKFSRNPSRLVFEANDLVIGYSEENPLSSAINFKLESRQKIAFVGSNGIGKSTLLKSLMGLIPALDGEVERGNFQDIAYYEQEVKEPSTKTVLDDLWDEYPSWNQAELRAALARVGLTSKQIESRVHVLSGGEQAKLRFAKLMNTESNILILDEPTNHLDVDAKDELKRALQAYQGTILMVSHEPEFYEGLVDEIVNCEEWTTKIL
ncbi:MULTISPECIES: ABC-F family ATP-binding cassette domain-containing protein [unclassified Lactococcus]|uniref:ABC-F family ATP-binding cassette domain-containing protein n=1 Tax=unclassified Lactococcus TaxID=2643510 RepID=UPI0011CC23CB|nr:MULTISPECIES: ABC-F family ATP-binding cassette domain-containing protein [unclassified Lactococcus]MQW22731.1 ATP-binding cassette domain-containing protein [Lactococcus sp. dk101]TXK44736.1 ABC-F family ATP-binding cassette domain-containing protein [Lactococcus sp. dk310]TXK50630.1 ABC-F family ATP-binding cassette domain-containing protein [Lactococcus sp. dk322]